MEMNEAKTNLAVNEILLRRKNMLVIPALATAHNQESTALVLAMAKNIESLGFTFSAKAIDRLFRYTYNELADFYRELMKGLKKLVGSDVEYHPMYPNFPQQVIEASDVELFVNAIVHYLSFGILMPEYEKEERLPLVDDPGLIVLDVANEDNDDLLDIMKNLISSKTSLSAQDKDDVEAIILTKPDYFTALPDEVPLKENVAFLSKLIIEKAPIKNATDIQKYYSTATDVLRLIVALSDGDISLAEKTTFKHLKRQERRMIMDLLAGCNGDILEDLFRYRDDWIRIAEILHVGEYHTVKYAMVVRAFDKLRNESKPLLFGGKVEENIKNGKDGINAAADLLVNRPGDFARRLDKLLRESANPKYILAKFEGVAHNVSTPVLLQVRQHFIGRARDDHPIRVFFPKGNVAKAIVEPNDLPRIHSSICAEVVRICEEALIKIYKETKEPLGRVYVDPDMMNYIVPFSQRSASSGSKMMVRGSSQQIGKSAKALRAFIWWTNTNASHDIWNDGRVDIDLSACVLDENFNYVSHVSYTRLRSEDMGYHSGDITNGGSVDGSGVAEFLDIDIDGIARNGRYVCFQVYSFTRQPFASLKNCRFGWMERDDVNSGEIFEPSTVEMNIKLTSDSAVAIPVIFDCKERKLVWLDMNLSIDKLARSGYGNNVETNLDGVRAVCYAMMHLNKPDLFDLITINAHARGSIVYDRNSADIIFSNDTTKPIEYVAVDPDAENPKMVWKEKDVPIITSFDLDYYMGKML